MANAGIYRCNNVVDTYFDLTVIEAGSMEIPPIAGMLCMVLFGNLFKGRADDERSLAPTD